MDDLAKLGPITFRVGRCSRCRRETKVYAIERVLDASDIDNLQTEEKHVCQACMNWAIEARAAA